MRTKKERRHRRLFSPGDPRTFPRLDQHLRRHPSPRPNDRRSRGELRGRDDASHGLPPIDVYFDGATYWLADGFHRYLATKRNQLPTILATVQPGGRSDALRHALGANATNGAYRTNADQRNAAEIALEEWPDKANPVLAELCRVSVDLVRRCRHEMAGAGKLEQPELVTGRDGKEYPAQLQRQPRGKTEGQSSDASAGGGGGFSKGKFGPSAVGGSTMELEREARAMIRKGEINPLELPTLSPPMPSITPRP